MSLAIPIPSCRTRHRNRRSIGALRSPVLARRARPRFEWLEDRTVLATFLVTNTADSGPGSLRQAILDSDAATGTTNTIDFAIPAPGVQTIAPTAALPTITKPVLIDCESQPGYSGTPLIELSGTPAGTGDGLLITAPNVTVCGLDIGGFSQGAGIHIKGTAPRTRLDPRQLPRHRPDRHAGRAQRLRRRDRRGSQQKLDRHRWRRRE